MNKPGSLWQRSFPVFSAVVLSLINVMLIVATVAGGIGYIAGQRRLIARDGARLAESIERELLVREYTIKALRQTAQELLDVDIPGRVRVSDFVYLPDRDAFSFAIGHDEALAKGIGNITGLGGVPQPGSEKLREMNVAMLLTPAFQTLLQRDPDTPWVYYTSIDEFIYLYPHVNPDEFIYSPVIKVLEFMSGATAEANPDHSVFWSSVYPDAAGKGPMVTVSAPVYAGDRLRGVVSADVGLAHLEFYLELVDIPRSDVRLVDSRGQLLARKKTGIEPSATASALATPAALAAEWIQDLPLAVGGWRLLVDTDQALVYRDMVLRYLPQALLVVFLFGILALLIMLMRLLARVNQLSTTDHLTGLLNRRMFDLQFSQELEVAHRRNQGLALAILDIDDFKKYNDSYGHQQGDQALKAVAGQLREVFKRGSDLSYRIGGEEFAITVHLDTEEQLAASLRKMVDAVASLRMPHALGAHGMVTVSIGGFLIKAGTAVSIDEAYSRADVALYLAKEAGKNRYAIVPALDPSAVRD